MKDFILHKEGIVSKKNCDRAISIFEEEKHYKDGTMGRGVIKYHEKKSSEIFLEVGQKNPYNDLFMDGLTLALDYYKEEYPFINHVAPWDISRFYKLQRYKPNEGYFALHCENDGGGLSRMLVWMIYLNDVTDDGFTLFPTQGKSFQPRTGDIVIWPAFWTHPHHGVTSKTQSKYILTGWWDYNLSINGTDYTNR